MKKYIRASFNNDSIPDWLKQDKGALRALNNNGIDLANCIFSKEKKGRVGDNYTAYLVKGSKDGDAYRPFVWIPGLYNDDNYVNFENWNKRDWRGNYPAMDSKAIKYIPKKDLNFIDTVYINIADNSKPEKEHYQDPRYDNNGNYAGQYFIPEKEHYEWDPSKHYTEPAHWSEQGKTTYTGGRYGKNQARDKSGYVIPDPEERLRKFHETEEGQTRQAAKASRELEIIYGELLKLKDVLIEDFNAQSGSIETFGKNSQSIDYFREAVSYYKRALDDITPKKYGNSEYIDAESALDNIEYAKSRINYAKKSLETGKTYDSRW